MTFPAQFASLLLPYLALLLILTTPLQEYLVPLLGLTTFLYLLSSFLMRKNGENAREKGNYFTSSVILFLVLSVISLTGGSSSLFFFLLYFVAFFLSFTTLPESVFVFAACSVLFYLFLEGKTTDSFSLSLHVLSLVLLSPLAYFFGKEYQAQSSEKASRGQLEEETDAATTNISKDVMGVLEENRTSLSDESIEMLNDILEESQEIKEGVSSK